jgi:hypothetical protein
MGTHWAKAITIVRTTDESGNLRTYHPGDFVPLRNQQLRLFLAKGMVELSRAIRYGNALALDGCGIVVTGGDFDNAKAYVNKNVISDVEVVSAELSLPFSRTLLWDGLCHLRLDLVPAGFFRLTTGWQVAAPVYSYKRLAKDFGDDDDRERTKAVVRDLRVPVYDPRTVYVRRCGDTERFMDVWRDERGGDDRLAFLRALYIVKPTICALPPTWIKTNGRG